MVAAPASAKNNAMAIRLGAWMRTVLLGTMGALALGLPAAAQPQSKTSSFTLTIPAAPLGDALNQFAQQTGLQVLFSSQLVAQMQGPRVTGSHTAEEALSQLLANTGLKFEFVNPRTITIVSASNPPSQPEKLTKSVVEARFAEQQGKDVPDENLKTTETNNARSARGDNSMKHNSFLARVAAFLGVCASASISSTACAQGVAAANASLELEEVVVTGSRVITNGNDSPTPVTVVSMDQLMTANPTGLSQALQQMPALLASPNQGGQGPGVTAVINLRGIYGGRNLVLIDGHRQPPTVPGSNAGVDTNLIPQMLLKRVDIVTGGASAVYGSDAVTGVINFVMDNNFNGVKFTGQVGQSTYNDDHTYNFGIAAGTQLFDGRGHIEASYQNFNDPGLPDRFSRAWGRGVWSMQGAVPNAPGNAAAGTVNNPYRLYRDVRFGTTNFGGVINSGTLAGLQFAQNGLLSTFTAGAPTGSGGVQIGGDGGYYTTTSAFAGQNMDQAFVRFDYDFTDTMKGYVEAIPSRVHNWANQTNANLSNRAIGYNNAYLSTLQPNYQALIAAARANPACAALATAPPTATCAFNFSRIFNQLDAFPAPRTETTENSLTFLAGLAGSLGDYKWDIGFEHAKETTKQVRPNNYSNPRLFAALNAVVNPANGQTVCNAALVNPAVYSGCVPLNVFGPTSMSRAAFDWISNPSSDTTTNAIDDVTASITGAPISSWAGPIDMALSGEWRRQTYAVDSTAYPSDPVSCTGIQFNCTSSTTPYQSATAAFPEAEVTVSEYAFEAQVPLLVDAALAKSLAFNGAARYTDYSTSGGIWSWKVGLTWAMNDALAVRATRSRDIRAPTLQNLFAPLTVGVSVPFADIQVNVPAGVNNIVTPTTQTRGNPNLLPEIGNTTTVGFVWTPQFIEGFSASIDLYDIDITQGINNPSPFQVATLRSCVDSGGTAPVCVLYVRPLPYSDHTAANLLTQTNNIVVNTGGVSTKGIDTELNYRRSIAGRPFSTRLLLNYQPHLIYDLTPAPIVDVGGAADGVNVLAATPNIKGLLQISYDVVENFTVTLQERARNAVTQNGNESLIIVPNSVRGAWYTDLNLNYKMKPGGGDLDVFLNIRNLINTPPDPWASTGGTGQIGTFGGWLQGDDPMGRYYTLGFRYKL